MACKPVYLKPITEKKDVDFMFRALASSGLSEEAKKKIIKLNHSGKGFAKS